MTSLGLGHDGPPDGQHLLLAAAQQAGLAVRSLLQNREQGEHPFEGIVVAGARLGQVRPQAQVL